MRAFRTPPGEPDPTLDAGGTTAGQAPNPGAVDPDQIRVELRTLRGADPTVALANGTRAWAVTLY